MFKKLRLFPITGTGTDGYPTYGTPIQLVTATESSELNDVNITITDVKKSKTLQGDDKERIYTKSVRYEGTLEVYAIEPTAKVAVFGDVKDTNSNVIHVVNSSSKKSFGLFFQGETPAGVKYQKILYNVTFREPDEEHATDTGENVASLKVAFDGLDVVTTSGTVRAATVYSGNTGFIAEGTEPTTLYKQGA